MKLNVEFQEPDRKKRIKRIIAREGLIILGCLLASAALFSLVSLMGYERPNYAYKFFTGGHEYEIDFSKFISTPSEVDKTIMFGAVKKLYPKDFKELGNISFIPDDIRIEYLGYRYTARGHIRNLFSNLAIVFLFLAYPLYLVVRFILWAIKTLREK